MNSRGGTLTHQLSRSHFEPQDFTKFMSVNKSGWMKVLETDEEKLWKNYFVDLSEGTIRIYKSQNENDESIIATISMSDVISFRSKSPSTEIVILTNNSKKWVFRAESIDDKNDWLFCIQKSVATYLSKLADPKSKTSSSPTITQRSLLTSSIIATNDPGKDLRSSSTDHHEGNRLNNHDLHRTVNEKVAQGVGNGKRQQKRHSFNSKAISQNNESIIAQSFDSTMFHPPPTLPFQRMTSIFPDSQHFSTIESLQNGNNIRLSTMPTPPAIPIPPVAPIINTNMIPPPLSSSLYSARQHSNSYHKDLDSSQHSYFNSNITTSSYEGEDRHKLASSYKATYVKESHLENVIQFHILERNGRYDNDYTEGSDELDNNSDDSNDKEDYGMQFELDEMVETNQKSLQSSISSQVRGGHATNGRASNTTPKSIASSSPRSSRAVSLADGRKSSTTPVSQGDPLNYLKIHHTSESSADGSSMSYHMRWVSGVCSLVGNKKKNEDRAISLPDMKEAKEIVMSPSLNSNDQTGSEQTSDDQIGYFAVYDGHVGEEAAVYLQQNLHNHIYRHPLFTDDLEGAITAACIDIDNKFLDICQETNIFSGTTALGVIIKDNQLIAFNIGDCEAIICNNGNVISLGSPHKPNRADESERVKNANGWITEEDQLYVRVVHTLDLNDPFARDLAQDVKLMTTVYRVCGDLSISRSIGDPEYKRHSPGVIVTSDIFIWPQNHSQTFTSDPIVATPECTTVQLTGTDEFLIIACDGIWDVLTHHNAVRIIKQSFLEEKTATQAATSLCNMALKLGSCDNVTAIVVKFIHN